MVVSAPRAQARPGKSNSDWVYLDHNATTPLHPDALAAMTRAATTGWANPASVHRPGQLARAELERARRAVGQLLGYHARDVTLTSGGTEANNLALWQPFLDGDGGQLRGTLLLSLLEHPSVVRCAQRLERAGVTVVWLDVSGDGAVDSNAVAEALADADADAPRLLTVQAVNHETGVVQPIANLVHLAASAGVPLHVDAVQAVGKLPQECWAGADSVSVAAHKIYGPKGIGALVTKPGVKLRPIIGGGDQERGGRPGTQSALLAAGFAAAAERMQQGVERYLSLASLRDELELELLGLAAAAGIAAERNGSGPRAPHVSNMSWPGWRGPELCAALDLERIAVSSGSACAAGTAEASPVITAMNGPDRAACAVRISLGEATTKAHVDRAVAAWRRVLARSTPQ